MKPPHSRRPGSSAGGGSSSGQGPSGRGPDRPYASRPGGPDRPREARRDSGPGAWAKPGERGPRRRDERADAPAKPAERPRGERTLTIRPPAETPRSPRSPQQRGGEERKSYAGAPRRHAAAPPADPDAPRGALWLYGTHAVAAALANPARRLRRLLLTEDAETAMSARLKQPWPVGPERTDRARLDTLLGRDVVHQGVALLVDPLAPPALGAVLERSGPVLVLDQVGDPRNVGAILRAAAAFGVAAVIVQDRNSPEETGALAKAASGALETMPLLRAVNIARTLVALKAAGCWVVGLDAGGANLSGPALAQRRVALVLGSEGEGLRRLTRDTCDEIAGIAMPGGGNGLDSLNVSAACAVALYELGRH